MWNRLLFEYRVDERVVQIYGKGVTGNLFDNHRSGCTNESSADKVLPSLGKDKGERDRGVKGAERRVASIH